jgi:hypothetical protein
MKSNSYIQDSPNRSQDAQVIVKNQRIYLGCPNDSWDKLDKAQHDCMRRLNRWHQNITCQCNLEVQQRSSAEKYSCTGWTDTMEIGVGAMPKRHDDMHKNSRSFGQKYHEHRMNRLYKRMHRCKHAMVTQRACQSAEIFGKQSLQHWINWHPSVQCVGAKTLAEGDVRVQH